MPRALLAASLLSGARAAELLGYLENWNDVVWWDNGIPHNCVQGCFDAQAMLNKTKPYSAINYGFVFFSGEPTPNQNGCAAVINKTTSEVIKTSAQACPVWDGEALYMSSSDKEGSHAIDDNTTIEVMTPGLVSIAEVVRLGRMHPAGPKRTKITLGGWSDFARLGSMPNAKKAAALAAKMVQFTFADGIDIDLEHLTQQVKIPTKWKINEFEAWATFILALRNELDAVSASWVKMAKKRKAALQKEHAGMDKWSKGVFAPFMNTTAQYLDELVNNGAPHLEISWTTRFNAFVPKADPYNYVKKWVGSRPAYNSNGSTFVSDNEGARLWPRIGDTVDTVNIMAYDAANISFDFSKILQNFVDQGVPASKINLGFEPGEQLHEATWEGATVDEEMANVVKKGRYAGCMVWAVNPSSQWNPKAHKHCPAVAEVLSRVLRPDDRFRHLYASTHKYTKVDPATGWLPEVARQLALAKKLRAKPSANNKSPVDEPKGAPTRPSLARPRKANPNVLAPAAVFFD
jgi:hypothetical protein